MLAHDLDEQALALNLSYVLHEPSTSRTVRRAVRDLRRFARRRAHLLRAFDNMSTPELAKRVSISPDLKSILEQQTSGKSVLTASTGFPELLPAAIAELQGTTQRPELIVIEQQLHPTSDAERLALFGHPTLISGSFPADAVTCGLVLMPDEKSLLLTGSPRSAPAESLEDLIRDFAGQWLPSRNLWDHPIEISEPRIRLPAWKVDGH